MWLLHMSLSLTLTEYIAWVDSWKYIPRDVLSSYIQKASQDPYNSFVRLHEDYALDHIDDFSTLALRWAPIGVKDIFMTKWYITSSASKMLENYVPPYSSTVFDRLEKAWWCMIGKTNMDDSAMWASGENSYFWPTTNPWDVSRVPWWSSSWSAASVAGDLCLAALGTDTWWSVRMPASLCWLVWVKPTYGRNSRYGIAAMSSSLDTAGVLTKTVDDAILLMRSIWWSDSHDQTTDSARDSDLDTWKVGESVNLDGKKFAFPNDFLLEWLDDRIRVRCLEVVDFLLSQWATVDFVDVPILECGVSTYYIICPAEVSTNISRLDGMRFWLQDDFKNYKNITEYHKDIRSRWLWKEVQRRVMMWSYVLSSWYYDAYYKKAQLIRAKMKKTIDAIFDEYDAIIWPTSPTLAWKLGEKVADPVQMYLVDIYTVLANLCWIPALSVPVWTAKEGDVDLPIWFQIMTKQWNEKEMFEIAKWIEKQWGRSEIKKPD